MYLTLETGIVADGIFCGKKAPPHCVLSISGSVTIQTGLFSTLVAHSWHYQIMLISQLNFIFFIYCALCCVGALDCFNV